MSEAGTTIVICTWNRSSLLAKTLDSLQRQEVADRSQFEVIVVDNNSSDDTRVIVEGLMPGWTLGRLRYLFEERQGKQFALNLGVREAAGPLIAFTDDDILFRPDWLRQVGAVFAQPEVELAGGKTLVAWPDSGRPAWYHDQMLAVLGGVDLGDHRLDPAPPGYAPAGGNLIARRSLFDRVGLFSEAHFRHMDFEFGMRCSAAGARVVYDPSLVIFAPVDKRCLTPRYFRRWSFKAGIARDGGTEAGRRRWPAAPRWIYRQAIDDAFALKWTPRGRLEPSAFNQELRLWRSLGTICNAWHGWLRPARHGEWVARYSQKKNNLDY